MNWTRKRTPRWLLSLLLLLSMTPMPVIATPSPSTPSDAQSMISIDDCAKTCDLEIAEALKRCHQEEGTKGPDSSQTTAPSSAISIETCETDCESELQSLRSELEKQCDESVTKAVADERRDYEPRIASLNAELDTWKDATERAESQVEFWRTIAFVAGGAAVVAGGLAIIAVAVW